MLGEDEVEEKCIRSPSPSLQWPRPLISMVAPVITHGKASGGTLAQSCFWPVGDQVKETVAKEGTPVN